MFHKFLIKAKPEELQKRFPQEVEELLLRVDRYLQQKISFTHPKDMESCTTEVEFEGNWELIPFGDIEWCYMLNRHRFIEEIATAYFITKEEKYYQGFRYYLFDWIDKNSDLQNHLTTTWRRIETGIRMVHWTKAIEMITYHHELDAIDYQKIVQSLLMHGKHLISSKNGHSYTSNWGAIEFRGLALLGAFYPCEETKEWLEIAKNHLIKMLHETTLADGVHWECSPTYHYEVNLCYLMLMLICKRLHIMLDKSVLIEIHKMSEVNALWQKPNFKQPQWGDSDDTDTRDLLCLASWLFEDGKMANRAYSSLDFENYLLLGAEGEKEYINLPRQEYPHCSISLKEGGLLCLRDSWAEDSSYLSLNSKKYVATHGHDDLLHVSYYARGKEYLIDCGRYTYITNQERLKLKFSQGHNTIILNDRENSLFRAKWSNVEGYFLQGEWEHQNGIDWAYSHNLSYLDDGMLITRNLIKFDRDHFMILDSILGHKEKRIELKFNTPRTIYTQENHYMLEDLCVQPDPKVEHSIQKSFYSPHYNELVTSDQLLFKMLATTDTTIVSLFSFDQSHFEYIPIFNRDQEEIDSSIATGIRVYFGQQEYVILYRLRQDISKGIGNHGPFMYFDGNYYIPSKIVLKKEQNQYRKLLMIN